MTTLPAIHAKRVRLIERMREAVRLRQHKKQAEIAAELRPLTTLEIKMKHARDLAREKRKFRMTKRMGRNSGQRATARKRARDIAQQMEQYA